MSSDITIDNFVSNILFDCKQKKMSSSIIYSMVSKRLLKKMSFCDMVSVEIYCMLFLKYSKLTMLYLSIDLLKCIFARFRAKGRFILLLVVFLSLVDRRLVIAVYNRYRKRKHTPGIM